MLLIFDKNSGYVILDEKISQKSIRHLSQVEQNNKAHCNTLNMYIIYIFKMFEFYRIFKISRRSLFVKMDR